MTMASWYGQLATVPTTAAELTVIAQTVSPYDAGQLLWDVFFPRRNVGSVKLDSINLPPIRKYTADRREWNARGRFIPYDTPSMAELEMVPIESYFKLGEREMQHLRERFVGNQAMVFDMIKNQLPDRAAELSRANYRRIEVDAFTAWATGNITARNATTGAATTFSFGFDNARYQTAGTAWTGGSSGTAYTNFIAWIQSAIDLGIPVAGVMLRTSTLEAIRSSCPNPFFGFDASAKVPVTLTQLQTMVQDQLGVPMQFYRNEHTVDTFATGTQVHTNTKLWPAHTIAVVPQGESIGYTAFAPVARAFDIASAVPEAKIDLNGQTVYMEEGNGGRDLTVECQVNALPVPVETNVYVIDAGI